MTPTTFPRMAALLALPLMAACSRPAGPAAHETSPSQSTATRAAPTVPATSVSARPPTPPPTVLAIGSQAPDFELPGIDGKSLKLSSFRGKPVVIEWFNPDCPYVKAAHTKGSLRNTAARRGSQGVVWLAINSAAQGKQGHGRELNAARAKEWNLSHAVLLDEDGSVGKAYGARRTPHMFVIDPEGRLVYQGAIDNSPDGEGESPTGGTLVNHVEAALDALSRGEKVGVPVTEPYGCSVKYASP